MGMQWYIIHTYSGFEKKVKESLESRVAAFSLQDKIGRVLIPMEEVVEVRGGKKVVSSRMSYPGYVLVEMDLDENTWHTVRSTPRVTGFVGSATSPSPLSEAGRCASWTGRLRISMEAWKRSTTTTAG